MCGRFTLTTPAEIVAQTFGLRSVPPYAPRYNIAPSQQALVVRVPAETGAARQAVLLKWGLIPAWAKDPAIGNRLINARAETVAEKPSFRAAFRRRRCLVVADGFYEWRAPEGAGRRKQPYWIHSADGAPMALAGIWERWSPDGAEAVESFAIITTSANALMKPIHARMPVVLERKAHEAWLGDADRDALEALLEPCPDEALSAVAVGSYVNDARHDDPGCIRPET